VISESATVDAMSEGAKERDVEKLLAELNRDTSVWRDEHRDLRDLFVDAAEPMAQLLFDVREAPGHQGFAVVQLITRGLNDLIIAFHLTLHGYLNQAYNEMRMAWEACDLVKLLGTDPSEATLWIESEKPWQDFSPSAVRKKLGKPKLDELYDTFCSEAHPRFTGASLTGYMLQKPDGEPASRLSLGPSPLIDERPLLAHAAMFVGVVLGRLMVEMHYLVEVSNIDEESFEGMPREVMGTINALIKAAVQLAAKSGQPGAAEDLDELQRTFREPLGDV
jgi:hypothetical protein